MCLTSNLCRSSSLPSSPSGWTGTLKYSPSSWDNNLYLNPKIKQDVKQNPGLSSDFDNKAPVPSACHCVIFPNLLHLLMLTSYHPSIPCFCSSEIPKDSDPMKSFLLVKSQSHTSTERRRSLSVSLRLLRNQNKGGRRSEEEPKTLITFPRHIPHLFLFSLVNSPAFDIVLCQCRHSNPE